MRAVFARRIRVQIVRRRLQDAAASAATHSWGSRPPRHERVAERLLLLSADAPAEQQPAHHDLARRARSNYGATSDVMHSRRAFGDVPEYLVQEWEAVADEVEAVMTLAGSVGPSRASKEA